MRESEGGWEMVGKVFLHLSLPLETDLNNMQQHQERPHISSSSSTSRHAYASSLFASSNPAACTTYQEVCRDLDSS